MLDTMKKEISSDIKKAYESGKMSASEIKAIVKSTVSKITKDAKEGVLDINDISKEAVVTAVTELKYAGDVTKENIEAVVQGAIEGISKNSEKIINEINIELLKTKCKLEVEKERFAVELKDALNGAKDAASNFSDEAKEEIADAVTDIKLKSIEILGIMKETVKHSVKVIIDEGNGVEEKVSNVTRHTIENALETGRLSAQKVKEVSETVILAAVDAAQEAEKEVKETTRGAVEGAKEGIVKAIEKAKAKLLEAKDFTEEDIKQTIEDLEAMNDAFIEALGNTSHKVGDVAQEVLHENIAKMKQSTSQIAERAEEAAKVAFDYLADKGSQVANSAKDKALDAAETAYDEAAELAEKMVKITKNALSDVIEGTKNAMKNDK